MRRTILILMGRYLPGHKDGGPLRTMVNVTDALGNEYDFRIACLDRDHGDTEPYPNIKMNDWNQVGNANVRYVRPGCFSFRLLRKLAHDSDLVYTCSFYDDYGYKTLLLNRMNLLFGKEVVVASMGVFSDGALAQKAAKKRLFISLCKWLGLFKGVIWSVTSELEAQDLKRAIGDKVEYVIAEDLPRTAVPGRGFCKKTDGFRLAFLSRISPQKNLLGAICALQLVNSEIIFNIYGPDEDKAYWTRCSEQLKMLPRKIRWEYHGDVPSEDVQKMLSENDAFILPTLGENYGHVIFEALSVGCIPIISDQTPWKAIAEKDAGFVVSATDTEGFAKTIDLLVSMPSEHREQMARNAVELAKETVRRNQENTGYRTIFG